MYAKRVACPQALTEVTGCKITETLPAPDPNVTTAAAAAADPSFKTSYSLTTMQDCCRPTCAVQNNVTGTNGNHTADGLYNSFYTCSKDGTPLTGAQIAGTHVAPCLAVTDNSYGTSVTAGSYSFYKQITLTSSYTYGISVMLFNSPNCVGGSQVFAYSQAGVYSIGASHLPGGATGIYYTATTSYLTVYGGTSGGGVSSVE